MKEPIENDAKKEDVKIKVESAKKSTLKKGPAVVVIPDDPPEILCPLLRAHSGVSFAMAIAASNIEKKTFSEYTTAFLELMQSKDPSTLPMVGLLYNGKGLPGKCQLIKRCLLIPNSSFSNEKISKDIRLVSFTLCSNLQTKTPMIMISESGEMVPSFDRPEEFLNVLKNVIKECGLEEEMRIVLEIGARGIFDMEKGKYEVIVGQMKSGDEVVSMLIDLVERYPIIVGLVDPLRTQDKEAWRNLGVALGNHCWIMGRSPRVQKMVEESNGKYNIVEGASETQTDEVDKGVPDQPPQEQSTSVEVSVMCSSIDGHSFYQDYISYVKEISGKMLCLWIDDLSSEEWLVDFEYRSFPFQDSDVLVGQSS